MLYANSEQSSQLAALPLGAVMDLFILKDIFFTFFDYAEQNGHLKFFIGPLWEKMSVGGGLVTLQFLVT